MVADKSPSLTYSQVVPSGLDFLLSRYRFLLAARSSFDNFFPLQRNLFVKQLIWYPR